MTLVLPKNLDLSKLIASQGRGGYTKVELYGFCNQANIPYTKSWVKGKIADALHATVTGIGLILPSPPLIQKPHLEACEPHRPKKSIVSGGARQKHGKDYELGIIKEYGMEPTGHTDKWDAHYRGYPVQIKFAQRGKSAIELADYFKYKHMKEDSFIIILGIWSDETTHAEIRRYCWMISLEEWIPLFECPAELDTDIKTGLASITNLRADDERWDEMRKGWRRQWGINRPVNLAPKRDHKSQKRMQCTITLNKLKEFNEYML